MSFQAKRLRVALPCGEATVLEEARAFAAGPEKIVKGVCVDWASFQVASCYDEFSWYVMVVPAQSVVSADQLPILRQQIEARLEEIAKAEQAVEERRSSE
jgi:hypothetical protein